MWGDLTQKESVLTSSTSKWSLDIGLIQLTYETELKFLFLKT